MRRLLRLFTTSIGSKQVMAVTGILLVLFVLVHMLGNLTVYQGPGAINAYGNWLQGHPLLWVFRIGLLVIALVHVALALRVAYENRRARPGRYRVRRSVQVGFAARTMLASGLVIVLFLVYHLAHLTAGVVGPPSRSDPTGGIDIYANVVAGFSDPWIAWGYVGAVSLLGLHLHHAVRSLFQTLGVSHESWDGILDVLAPVLAGIITVGFASVPVAVQLGVIGAAA